MTRPFWIDPDEQHYPELMGHIYADLAIVGGGLTGLGAAYALVGSGASVVLLEARTLGSGASGRNGGFVLAGPAHVFCDAVDQMGEEAALELWHLTEMNNQFIGKLVEDHSFDCGYLRRGSMSVAVDEAEAAILERSHRALTAHGVSTCLVKAESLPRPFDHQYFGGLYYGGNAEMNSGAFVRSIGALVSSTIAVHEYSKVDKLLHDGRWRLITRGGSVSARGVILAANAYTPEFWPAADCIVPRRGQVVATGPLDRVIVPFPMYGHHGYQYWRQTSQGQLVVGGWRYLDASGEIGTAERAHEPIQSALADFACLVAGKQVPITHRWSGIMGFTADMLPLVGVWEGFPDAYIAAGYSGHGVALAFICGYRVARAAIGEVLDVPNSLDPNRFRAIR